MFGSFPGVNKTKWAAFHYDMKRRPVLFLIANQVLDCQRSANLKAIKVHDLDPCVDKVAGKFLTGVVSGVDFCDRPQL